MLLETAGFLPLKNIAQQLQVHQIETANSSERPHNMQQDIHEGNRDSAQYSPNGKLRRKVNPAIKPTPLGLASSPACQEEDGAPDHELFYAP